MLKKILCFVLSSCLLMTCISTVYATKEDVSYDLETLNVVYKLGILPDFTSENFVPDRQMFKGDYIHGILNILGDNYFIGTSMSDESKSMAYINGLIGKDFDEQYESITFEDAVSYSLIALGYTEELVNIGYPIMSVTKEITRGINLSNNDILTQNQAITLLYNTAFASPLKPISWRNDGSTTSTVDKNEALIYQTRDIYIVDGIVTQTSVTSLDNSVGLNEERISIGKKTYNCSDKNSPDYLGYSVSAYIKENETGLDDVMHISKSNDNDELVVEKESLLDVNNSCRQLSYWKDNKRKQQVKLAPALKCIYNGRCIRDYKRNDFMIDEGRIVLIDNNSDGVFDVAKIINEKQMIVDVISKATYTLYGKFTYTNALDKLVLDEDKATIVIKKSGQFVELEDIAVNDVLNVQISKELSNPYIHVTVSSSNVSGELEMLGNDEKVYIAGKEYETTYAFLKAKEFKDKMYKELSPGLEYKFLLDYNGRIAYAELISDGNEQTGYLFKLAIKDDAFQSSVMVRIFDINGVWHTYELAEKTVMDKNKKTTAQAAYDYLEPSLNKLIKYKFNSEGKIKIVTTATETEKYIPDKFICSPSMNKVYYTGDKSFTGTYYVDSQTTFVVKYYNPNGTTEDDFAIMNESAVGNLGQYDFVCYGFDEFNRADIVYLEYSERIINDKQRGVNWFVVTSIGAIYENGEAINVVSGNQGKTEDVKLKEKAESLSDIKIGDVISVFLDNEGFVNKYTKRFNVNDTGNVLIGDLYAMYMEVKGNVEKVDPNKMYITLTDGTNNATFRWLNSGNVNVHIYYKDRNIAKIGSVTDIEKDDYVIIRYQTRTLKEICIIR